MAASSIAYQFKMANIVVKIIAINVAVFLLFLIIPWILNVTSFYAKGWFVLPAKWIELLQQPWSLITYQFLHVDFWHIFWNMMVLYFFGNIVLNIFTEKRFLTVYILGGIAGGILFAVAYNLFPVLQGSSAYLQGASASVMAIMIFMATYRPNTEVRLLVFNVKLWHIGIVLVLMDLIQIPASQNAGGLISHLGGAIFGYIYAQQLAKGKDIGLWWEKLLDSLGSYFKKKDKTATMKTVYKKNNSSGYTTKTTVNPGLSKSEKQIKIDTILDKISKSGYDSLSKQEKDFLFQAGKDN